MRDPNCLRGRQHLIGVDLHGEHGKRCFYRIDRPGDGNLRLELRVTGKQKKGRESEPPDQQQNSPPARGRLTRR